MKTTLLMATTLDGKIGRNSSHLVDWTGKDDKELFVKLTKDAGVIIMGSNTFDTLTQPLPGRRSIVMTRNRSRITRNFQDALLGSDELIFTDKSPGDILAALGAAGYETTILIGGSKVNSLYLEAELIDEIYVTIVPRFFGKGLSMFSHDFDTRLELVNIQPMDNGHITLKYIVCY